MMEGSTKGVGLRRRVSTFDSKSSDFNFFPFSSDSQGRMLDSAGEEEPAAKRRTGNRTGRKSNKRNRSERDADSELNSRKMIRIEGEAGLKLPNKTGENQGNGSIREGADPSIGDADVSCSPSTVSSMEEPCVKGTAAPISGRRCHQYKRNKGGRVAVDCSKCGGKRYCITCIRRWYPQMSDDLVRTACPFCRGNCNCID